MKALVEACPYCNTSSYTVSITEEEADKLPAWIECTSGYGLYGGGACCAPLGVRVVPEDYVPNH